MYSSIDIIKDKFLNGKPMPINEACFVLWAELSVCSTQYLLFQNWIDENKLFNKKFKWQVWEGLFNSFIKNEYPHVEHNYTLIAKVKQKYSNKKWASPKAT